MPRSPGIVLRLSQAIIPPLTPLFVWGYRRLGHHGAGEPTVLLLTTTGRHSGRRRTVPLYHLNDHDSFIVAGGNLGRRPLPSWVRNLRADPRAQVEVGGRRMPVTAESLDGRDRDDAWRRFTDAYPGYEDGPRLAGRDVPLIRLRRAEAGPAAHG